MTHSFLSNQNGSTFLSHRLVCVDLHLDSAVTERGLRDDRDDIDSIQFCLNDIRGRFRIRVGGPCADACNQRSPNNLLVILADHLPHVFVPLEGNVSHQLPIEIDETMTGTRVAWFDQTANWTGRASHSFSRWLYGLEGILWTDFCACLAIDAEIRDGSLLFGCHGDRLERTDLDAQPTADTSLPVNNHC